MRQVDAPEAMPVLGKPIQPQLKPEPVKEVWTPMESHPGYQKNQDGVIRKAGSALLNQFKFKSFE